MSTAKRASISYKEVHIKDYAFEIHTFYLQQKKDLVKAQRS